MELRKYKKTYSTGDLQVTDSTVKVKFEVSQYQESRNWKKVQMYGTCNWNRDWMMNANPKVA
jgi:hypothetical protein